MEQEKVKISRELAIILEKVMPLDYEDVPVQIFLTDWSYIKQVIGDGQEYSLLRNFYISEPVTYIRAITEGYELKPTPNEQIKTRFNLYRHWSDSSDHDVREEGEYRLAELLEVLEILDIKIPGVND